MKSVLFAALAASAILAGGAAPAAAAYDYPYCLQGPSWGYPGFCQFNTYDECRATASGTDAGCGTNPAVGFAPQQDRPTRYRAR
jgi:hypothetical protein